MPLFSITGLSGTGKSAVNIELRARGYESYDGDEDHLAAWYNKDTGSWVDVGVEECTPEFLRMHSRDIPRATVEKLASKAGNRPVFLCGAHENESDLQDLFLITFGLVLNDKSIEHRLSNRTNNPWGKLPHHRAYSLAFKDKWYENARRSHYVMINADQPTKDIVDFILAKVGA